MKVERESRFLVPFQFLRFQTGMHHYGITFLLFDNNIKYSDVTRRLTVTHCFPTQYFWWTFQWSIFH